MRILGIDPGYGITGFGIVEAHRGNCRLVRCGAITTPAGMDFSARLEIIYEDMRKLLEVAKPDAVAIEELFFGHHRHRRCPEPGRDPACHPAGGSGSVFL